MSRLDPEAVYFTRPLNRPRSSSQLPGILVVGIVAVILTWFFTRAAGTSPLHDSDAKPRVVTPRGDLAEDEKATIALFKAASPAVVYITNLALARERLSFDEVEIPRGAGSGFIYDANGYVVTNFHVIREASVLRVTLADHSDWDARVVGTAIDKDIAVLKIDAPSSRLQALPLGTSADLVVGQKVFAIGDPFGLDQTLTTGIVSALGRQIQSLSGRTIHDVIQTDAAINPGNSGGPLLDSAGRLIGVNTQIASPSGASAGIGFAVPVDIVRRVVPELIRHGKIVRPGLGVVLVPDNLTRQLGFTGVLVGEVREGGAAQRSGLRGTIITESGSIRQLGDVLTRIDDHKIKDANDLLDALENHAIGDEIDVMYEREGKQTKTRVKLQAIDS